MVYGFLLSEKIFLNRILRKDHDDMRESEEKMIDPSDQKSKIRERYKGINEDELDVIPAIPQEDFYRPNSVKRVAVYARVSTDDPRQTSSYELQKNHYTDLVNRREDWVLIDIYADEGISGTSLKHRDNFIRMIADCEAGKIDLIVTKSVSRFARNVLDCIGYVRKLAAMTPPIGVFFETENIYTLNPNSEMSLSFISTLAQEESHNKSEIMNASIEMRFKRGIFLTPVLLGYDQDEDGNLVVNESEAKIVRLIFFMYMYGYTCKKIADTLTRLECKTKRGNINWAPATILQILQNERHCGDVLARKTWTPNYLNHKSKKNNHDRNQYRQRNHHEAIISRDDFIAVQRMIQNAKYGNRHILPELKVIKEGGLAGFVSVNPRWAGFKPDDYREASLSGGKEDGILQIPSAPLSIDTVPGDFDLRGYEVARGAFFGSPDKVQITLTDEWISFNNAAITKFAGKEAVEFLVHPGKMIVAVRCCDKENKNAMFWSRRSNGKNLPKRISGRAFMPALFELFNWNHDYTYRIIGNFLEVDGFKIITFNLKETEVLIPDQLINEQVNLTGEVIGKRRDRVPAYPQDWSTGFGINFYYQEQADEFAAMKLEASDINAESEPYKEADLQTTDIKTISNEIEEIMEDLSSDGRDVETVS